MAMYHIFILALIQGITEFLPISSSGHLVLYHDLFGEDSSDQWADDLSIDVAVHVGTLASVMLYFWRDIRDMLFGLGRIDLKSNDTKMIGYIGIASAPVIIAGFALFLWKPDWLRSIEVMGWATLVFGVLLWWVDHRAPSDKILANMSVRSALIIGLAQVLALIPGTSRSGITMTAARHLGFCRTNAAKFSMLLAIVAISGAGVIGGLQLYQSGDLMLGVDMLIAALLAFLSGWIAIALMMRWLEKATFTPFAVYRIILGAGLLGLFYTGVIG